jgi:hypothetical protein
MNDERGTMKYGKGQEGLERVPGGVAEGRGWKLTIKICTFIDIENMPVM